MMMNVAPPSEHTGPEIFKGDVVWLVGFYGISTFLGYLMPNPFLGKYFYFKQFSLA